jgi:dihydroxyacetone kinase-like protein
VTGNELRELLGRALIDLAGSADELGQLDGRVGDGDLGVTVAASASTVAEKLASLPAEAPPKDVLLLVGSVLRTANPSTLATLAGAAVEAGAATLADRVDARRDEALSFAETASATIARLGRSAPGDKTILDAMIPSVQVLRERQGAHPEVLADMIAAARDGVEATRDLQAKRGRARWVAERAIGVPDPGAVAYLRLLEALARALYE